MSDVASKTVPGVSEAKRKFDVLVVDDEPVLLDELREFLGWNDINVRVAADGNQAIAALADDPQITVVLTDIRMPGLDGLNLASAVLGARGEADCIEVVLMTGHGDVETAARAVRAGVFDFLRKPMVLVEMLSVLARADARARARRQAYTTRVTEMAALRADYAALRARVDSLDLPAGLGNDTPPELAHILSHELRTPLIPLLALPEILQSHETLPPGLFNTYLRDVQQAGERLQEIANDLIEFLAPAHERDFEWRCVKVDVLVTMLKSRLTPLANAAGISVVQGEVTDGVLDTDVERLTSALRRLAANALAATRRGGRIDIGAHDSGLDKVVFTVRDNGCGMTPQELAHARQPFRQVDMSLTRRGGGMGLGLPLAIRMAERLGGRLTIESTPGNGTSAAIVLPRHRVAPREP